MVRSQLLLMFASASTTRFFHGEEGVASFGLFVDSSQEMERNWMNFRMTSPSYRILTLSSFTGGLPPPLRARRARTEATLMVSRDAVFRKFSNRRSDGVM